MSARAMAVPARAQRRGLAPRLRKYVAAFRVSLLSVLAYPAELWLRTVFLFIIMLVFSALWHTTYEELGQSRLGGLSLSQLLWYLAITESIMLSRPRTAIQFDADVRSGQLAYDLARPYSYLLFRFAQTCGERLPRFLTTLAVAVALATVFSGGVGVGWDGLAAGLPVLALALTLDYLFVLTICLLAFWVEDTSAFLFIYDRFLMILGGMLLPLELFPDALAAVARALPFAGIVYAPARMFVAPDLGDGLALVARQLGWLAVALLAGGWLFRYATRRLQSNGG